MAPAARHRKHEADDGDEQSGGRPDEEAPPTETPASAAQRRERWSHAATARRHASATKSEVPISVKYVRAFGSANVANTYTYPRSNACRRREVKSGERGHDHGSEREQRRVGEERSGADELLRGARQARLVRSHGSRGQEQGEDRLTEGHDGNDGAVVAGGGRARPGVDPDLVDLGQIRRR